MDKIKSIISTSAKPNSSKSKDNTNTTTGAKKGLTFLGSLVRGYLGKVRLIYLEGLNAPHLKIRLLHDKTYKRGGSYKKWTDKGYSSVVHKLVLISFIISFSIFTSAQFFLPNFFNLWKDSPALAGTAQKVWNTLADFTNNNGETGNITSSNINLNNGDPKLSTTAGSNTENTTAQFTAGTKSNTAIGTDNVFLLKPIGATCSVASECSTGACSDTCLLPWIAGRADTAMAGKEVYYQNSSSAEWETSVTSCVGPQCATGLDPNYSANNALVASNTVDFALYPARNACKTLGARLPYMNELLEMYAGRATYGNNFGTYYFWSATEYSPNYARHVYFTDGKADVNYKTNTVNVRCVR